MQFIQYLMFPVLVLGLLYIALLIWCAIGIAPRFMKRFFCWIGWHSPSREWKRVEFDGCSEHVVCPWCKYQGMVDGQGNLF